MEGDEDTSICEDISWEGIDPYCMQIGEDLLLRLLQTTSTHQQLQLLKQGLQLYIYDVNTSPNLQGYIRVYVKDGSDNLLASLLANYNNPNVFEDLPFVTADYKLEIFNFGTSDPIHYEAVSTKVEASNYYDGSTITPNYSQEFGPQFLSLTTNIQSLEVIILK